VIDGRPRGGGEGHREQRADDPGQYGARGEREQDRHGVQRDGLADDEGVEQVALDLLDGGDRHHDEDPAGDERDERRHGARQRRSDERQEGAQEGEDHERDHERDADERDEGDARI